jgi:hypothetical protein
MALRCGEAPAGQARWTLGWLADKAVELEIVPAISHETVRQVLKKRIETASASTVCDSPGAECGVCGAHGRHLRDLSFAA